MEPSLHMQILKKAPRRRMCRADRDEAESGSRPLEAPELPAEQNNRRKRSSHDAGDNQAVPVGTRAHQCESATHCASSPHISVSCGFSRSRNYTTRQDENWDSLSDSDGESDTSTPGYKRGKHTASTSPLEQKAILELRQGSQLFSVPTSYKQRKSRGPSVLILADSQLHNWPARDPRCRLEYRQDWPLKHWAQAIRMGRIQVECHTVILYLESTKCWNDVPPIKNALLSLCKAIRNHSQDPRIFVTNHLPGLSGSPVRIPVVISNYTLQQATRSVCRAMGKVFELSMYEHFMSSAGKVIKPAQKYLGSDGLTPHGCLIFRECLLREAGLKGYWFAA